jgi:hypothetical protein
MFILLHVYILTFNYPKVNTIMKTFKEFMIETINNQSPRKDIASFFRDELKKKGIKAKVRITPGKSSDSVQVYTPSHDSNFTSDEIKWFTTLAKDKDMKFVRGTIIDPEHESKLTGKETWEFHR